MKIGSSLALAVLASATVARADDLVASSDDHLLVIERISKDGSEATCDVTLPGTAALHVRVVLGHDGYTVEDVSGTGIEVDRRAVTEWRSALALRQAGADAKAWGQVAGRGGRLLPSPGQSG